MGFLKRLFGKKEKNEVEVKEEIKELPVEEPVEETPTEEPKADLEEEGVAVAEEPVEAEPEVELEEELAPESNEENPDEDKPIYEIKVHKDGGWQVVKKGATRAKRRLETQAKAMEYCRENNLKYEVYKMDGTLK